MPTACDRVFAMDDSCQRAAGELEASVQAFFQAQSGATDEPGECERHLVCNAPTCHCPAGYRCALVPDGSRADCVGGETTDERR